MVQLRRIILHQNAVQYVHTHIFIFFDRAKRLQYNNNTQRTHARGILHFAVVVL